MSRLGRSYPVSRVIPRRLIDTYKSMPFDAAGAGFSSSFASVSSASNSELHNTASGASVVAALAVAGSVATATATFNGTSMTVFGHGDGLGASLYLFGITGVASGSQSVAFSITGSSITLVTLSSESYLNVQGFGTPVIPVSASSGNSATAVIPGVQAAQCFMQLNSLASFIAHSAYSPNLRKTILVNSATTKIESLLGDGTTGNFSATFGGSPAWLSAGVPLIPVANPPIIMG